MQDKSHFNTRSEIWIINQYAITPDLPGGTRHYDFGCELVNSGYLVRIFASDVNLALRTRTKLPDEQLWREEDFNGVRFIWVRAATYQANDWRRAWNMLSFGANVLRVGLALRGLRPRTIIGSSPHPFAALSAYVLAKLKGARFVLELRDLWPQALVDMGGLSERSLVVKGMRILEFFLYRVAESIIVLAPGSESYLLKRGVPKRKIVYIPNGVHLRNFSVDSPGDSISFMDVVPLTDGDKKDNRFFTIVYTGAHGPANSLDTVLGAARLLVDRPDIRFILVGDGPSKASLVKKASELNLPNVLFLEPVPKNEIPRLLTRADATLITLRAADAFAYAVSPNKLFDYMAAGKPVLCAVPGDMARLVEENCVGFSIEPENPEALAKAVLRLKDMPHEERAAMGQRGRELIERCYSREQLAKELMRVL